MNIVADVNYDRSLWDKILFRKAEKIGKRAAEKTLERARQNLSPHSDTGETARSLRVVQASPNVFLVGSSEKHVKFAERGRGPIMARPGKVLRFKPRGSNKFVFARKVGPAKPIHFLRDAARSLDKRDFK